ncbi:hypothetical protein SDC9_154096 [bioreactor metagenome]|uniref:Uncharacterized protein n=1 Tax=bioreactor metagenome TaxID=1076179 RepID=A0A645F077_9ZZZZ
MPTGDHGPDEILALDAGMERNGRDMQREQQVEGIDDQAMPAGGGIAQRLVDQRIKRAVEGDVVVGEQAAGGLEGQQAQQGEDGKRAQRVVADALPLAAQVGGDLARCRKKGGEAGVGGADKSPNQPECEQPDHRQPQPPVPDHPATADQSGAYGAQHRRDKAPVKEAKGKVPQANAAGGHGRVLAQSLRNASWQPLQALPISSNAGLIWAGSPVAAAAASFVPATR